MRRPKGGEVGITPKPSARLRFVYLATHLKTPAILSATQIEAYNRLRGY